jgi:hypothetical protein
MATFVFPVEFEARAETPNAVFSDLEEEPLPITKPLILASFLLVRLIIKAADPER